jgi:hypothetical protein
VPLRTLRGYLELDDEAEPARAFHRAATCREELLARARRRLEGDCALCRGLRTCLASSLAAAHLRI